MNPGTWIWDSFHFSKNLAREDISLISSLTRYLFSSYKIIILLIFHFFMWKMFCYHAVLKKRISLSHQEENFIHQFPQNMEGVWPATPLFKNKKRFSYSFQASIPNFVKFGNFRPNPYLHLKSFYRTTVKCYYKFNWKHGILDQLDHSGFPFSSRQIKLGHSRKRIYQKMKIKNIIFG